MANNTQTTWFMAPEGAATVSRNGVYPVENGIFGVDDSEDAEQFRAQGYAETGAPVEKQEAPVPIPPRSELQDAPMPDVKALATRLRLEFKGNISREVLLDQIDTKRPVDA